MDKSVFIILPVALVILGGIGYYTFSSHAASSTASTASTAQSDLEQAQTAPADASQQQAQAATGTAAVTSTNQQKIMQATLHTNKGDITIAFNPELAPNAVNNFIKLAQQGYYDGTKFHRVIKGFMIQGGDPLTKDDSKMAAWGTGGPGYKFDDEITPDSHNSIGMVAMANSGPNTNGSQFYINTANNGFLDGKYTVFAHVTAGMDVVTAIENTPTGQADRPTSPIIVTSVTVQ